MARASQCRYKEDGRRCRRNGTGEPELCAAHRKIVEDAARRAAGAGAVGMPPFGGAIGEAIHTLMNGGRLKRDTLDRAAAELLASLGIGAAAFTQRPPPPTTPPQWPPFGFGQQQPRQPPPDPRELERARARRDARQVLGFTASEPLTEEQIKARRRELALKVHPDRQGGSARDMARVNDAADILLESA